LGFVHVTTKQKINAKAGNINNALKQASGEICVVLDPDHEPFPEFLDRVLPYFENEEIGFVQCVQAYGNQKESFIALGAAEQTYHFYGPMMMTMNTYGTVQAIGANCSFRRKALDSIGGHAAGLAEDMHTAMQLHAKGWKSVYIPEILSRGLVPATLSSYYKQQLKWSRGTFELLFRTYPKLFRNFTGRQKLHYFALPNYFLFGLINLVDILIPILALLIAEVPWEINLAHFAIYFLPLCILSLAIRMFAQRWLLEKHERGFHLAGGILRTATWWIFLVGFVYTILNIRVPYIPTPKEDEHENYLKLCIPNILVVLASIASVVYGLAIDWTPYSMAMAFYSLLISGMLAFTALMSQQKFLLKFNRLTIRIPGFAKAKLFLGDMTNRTKQSAYNFMQNGYILFIIAISLAFLSYSKLDNETDGTAFAPKEFGGFYVGAGLFAGATDLKDISDFESKTGRRTDILSFQRSWEDTTAAFPEQLMDQIHKKGNIPFIQWQTPSAQDSSFKDLFTRIAQGKYDIYLKKCAAVLRHYKEPVLLSFSPGADTVKGRSAEEFVKAWQYLYSFFNGLGISNITWVWCPAQAHCKAYYPGEKFVDWIGVACLNYGDNKTDNDWYSFKQLYQPYRNQLGSLQKPVIVTEFGAANGPDAGLWVSQAFTDLKELKEVRAVLFYTGQKETELKGGDAIFVSDFSLEQKVYEALAEQLAKDPYHENPLPIRFAVNKPSEKRYVSPFIKGSQGNFQLLIRNKPYYFKGVAYNTAHDWRDGFMPLTRRQLEKDFSKIKEMGANTIRRYDHGIYDKNVLAIAAEHDLNVMFGFWFDPKVDYYKDTLRVKHYMQEVEEKVIQFKNERAVIAWSLGNETWGLLKHHFAKPYLTKVRMQYIRLIEQLARRIHELDPGRPVFSCIEHEKYQIAGELVAFHDGAPSIDVIGVNSYYKEQISQLNHLAWQFDSLRPYLVSEFGPHGYWDPHYNKTSKGLLVEESDLEKSNWYKHQWKHYIEAHKGYNIGGFAYCWHDRMEGSCTWFGLTDFKGRPKPSYYALKEVWARQLQEPVPQISIKGPASYVPGKTYQFDAVFAGQVPSSMNFEWYLHKNEFLERIDNIEVMDNGTSVLLKIPETISDYRLYLYASREDGKVLTASLSIPVKKTIP